MDPGHASPAKDCPMRRPTAARYPGSAARCASAARPHAKRQRGLQPAVWLVMVLWTAAAAPLHAQGVHTKTGQGYTVTVEQPWQSSVSYQPLWITITPAVAPTSQRRIGIEAVWHRDDYRGGLVLLRAERSIDIRPEEGTSPRTTTVLVPLVEPYDAHLQLRFREDDRVLNALEVRIRLTDIGMGRADLFVTDQPKADLQRRIGEAMGLAPTDDVSHIETPALLPLARLPQQWIELSGVDVLWIALNDLRRLAQIDEPRFRALRSWTAAGGVLIVHGLRPSAATGPQRQVPDRADLRQIEQLLELAESGQSNGGTQGGWRTLQVTVPQYGTEPAFLVPPDYGNDDAASGPIPSRLPAGAGPAREPQVDEAATLPLSQTAHHLELGTVVAVADASGELHQELMQQRKYVTGGAVVNQRYGGTPPWMPDFDEFLVPGVGRPPVVMFHILITLFVIGIGPVNYLLLRRKKKLYLMLVTVPAIALGVTAALLGYAALSDGFAVRVRARTYTAIDQTHATPRAVSFARLSYYAGLAPGDGLRFPTDTVVLSFDRPEGVDWHRLRGSRHIVWDRDQHLASGWIVSRSPMQLVTARSRQTQARLRIEPAEEGAPPRVTNELGTHIHYLVLCDAQGNHFAAEQLAPGEGTALRADNVQAVRTAMQQSIAQASQAADNGALSGGSGYPYGRYRYGPDRYAGPAFGWKPSAGDGSADPCLDRGLRAAQQKIAQPTHMRPRTYVALVEKSPEVDFGVAGVRQVSSLHVIVGRW